MMYPITHETMLKTRNMCHPEAPITEEERTFLGVVTDLMNIAFNRGRNDKPMFELPDPAEAGIPKEDTALINAVNNTIKLCYEEGAARA